MDGRSVVVAAPEHLSAHLGQEAVVLGVERGVYFGMDEVASYVWDRVQDPVLVGVIRDSIVETFDVDAPTCERDLVAFLTDLSVQGMVRELDGPDP
jgi:hypothetical protein